MIALLLALQASELAHHDFAADPKNQMWDAFSVDVPKTWALREEGQYKVNIQFRPAKGSVVSFSVVRIPHKGYPASPEEMKTFKESKKWITPEGATHVLLVQASKDRSQMRYEILSRDMFVRAIYIGPVPKPADVDSFQKAAQSVRLK